MKYIIIARCIEYFSTEVDAGNEDEALELAENLDGADFTEDISSAIWDIVDIQEA